MKIQIIGETPSAIRLRSLIERDPDLTLGEAFADFRIHLAEGDTPHPVVDGVDGELERLVVAEIGALTPSGQVLLQFAAGRVTSDLELAITVPINEGEQRAVEHGLYRGLLKATRRPRSTFARWRRFLPLALLCILLPQLAAAQLQQSGGGGGVGGTVSQGAAGDPGDPWHVTGDFEVAVSPLDEVTASGTIDALNESVVLELDGRKSVSVQLDASGTYNAQFHVQTSIDGGTTWRQGFLYDALARTSSSYKALNDGGTIYEIAPLTASVFLTGGETHVRITCVDYTSGTFTASLRGTEGPSNISPSVAEWGTFAPAMATFIGGLDSGGFLEVPRILGSTPSATEKGIVVREAARGQGAMADSIPVAIASNQSAIPVTGTFWQATQPVSGTVSLGTGSNTIGSLNLAQYTPLAGRLPVDASGVTLTVSGTVNIGTFPTNTAFNMQQVAGSTTSIGNGVADSGTQRVVIASNQTAFTTNVGTFPDNEPFNVAQINGVAPSMGNGASGTGVQRVTLASDSPVPVSSFPDNEPFNVAQINGAAPSMGNGASGAGVQRVTIASDSTGQITANAGTNLNTSALNLEATQADVRTALQIIDDWDESDRAKANIIVGQAGITAGAGAVAANTPRVTHASDDPVTTALQIIDDWDESDRAKVNPIVGQAGVQGGAGSVSANTQRVAMATDANVVSTKTALTFNAPTAATVGVASAQALASNASRRGLVAVNTSNNTISCSVAQTAVLNSGITLEPGAVWTMNEYTFATGAVNCIASAASSNLSLQEMQ